MKHEINWRELPETKSRVKMKPKSSESWRVDAADQRRSSTDAMATSTAAANFLLFAGAGLWCRSPIPLIKFSIPLCRPAKINFTCIGLVTSTLRPRDDHSRHSTQQHGQLPDESNNTQQQLKHLLLSRRKTLKVSLPLQPHNFTQCTGHLQSKQWKPTRRQDAGNPRIVRRKVN